MHMASTLDAQFKVISGGLNP